MNSEFKIHWQYGRWIVQSLDGRLGLADDETCRSDWPIFYDEDRAGYDYPELWPSYVKSAVRIVHQFTTGTISEETARQRLSVCTALAFMDATPKTRPDRNFLWWAAGMPGYPEEYDHAEWIEESDSLEHVWDAYMGDLRSHGLHEYAQAAGALDLSALGFDFAGEPPEGLWLWVRVYCDRKSPHVYSFQDSVIVYRPALDDALAQIEAEHGTLYTFEIEDSFDPISVIRPKGEPSNV